MPADHRLRQQRTGDVCGRLAGSGIHQGTTQAGQPHVQQRRRRRDGGEDQPGEQDLGEPERTVRVVLGQRVPDRRTGRETADLSDECGDRAVHLRDGVGGEASTLARSASLTRHHTGKGTGSDTLLRTSAPATRCSASRPASSSPLGRTGRVVVRVSSSGARCSVVISLLAVVGVQV